MSLLPFSDIAFLFVCLEKLKIVTHRRRKIPYPPYVFLFWQKPHS